MNERIVCLDIGDVRIGVAVSDPTGTIASPVEVIRRVGWGPDTQKIMAVCERFETDRILSGLPLNMDGSAGFRAQKTARFIEQLKEHTSLPIELYDERLTTVSAHHFLQDTRTFGQKRKNIVDTLSAEIILQDYLDRKRRKNSITS